MTASIITIIYHEAFPVRGEGWDSSLLEVIVYSEEVVEMSTE